MKTFTGVVTSTGMQKTAVVQVTSHRMNAKYKKAVKQTQKFMVHDEESKAKVGDTVIFTECRPISKKKSFTLQSIVSTK